MSSIIKVDQIQLSDGSTPTAGDLGITGTGKILNIVSQTFPITSDYRVTSTSYADTIITASITPSATSNKVLVMVSWPSFNDSWSQAGLELGYRLTENGVGVFRCPHTSWTDTTKDTLSIQHLASPQSTTAVTYTLQQRRTGVYSGNPPGGVYGTSSIPFEASITLMEIAG